MTLSNQVFKTVYKDKEVFFNTVNNKILPTHASNEILKNNFFLKGQELNCIEEHLFKPPTRLFLNVIPTWKCNLRCSHCSVLHLLKSEDPVKLDKNKYKKFLVDYLDEYPTVKHFTCLYVGGESLLEIDDCLELSDIVRDVTSQYKVSLLETCTTNLALDMNIKHVQFLQRLQHLQVSVDGNHEQHNQQRHGFVEKKDYYFLTINNIKKLIKLGLRDILHVQAAVKDKYCTKENIVEYTKFMMRLGVKFDKILYGAIHPTVLNPKLTETFKTYRKVPQLRALPCCKYRFMSHIEINPDGSLYDNFYKQESSKLGFLSDTIKDIAEKHKNNIRQMPIFKDKNCMSCPVIGYCWGQCVNGELGMFKPSDFCAKEQLTEKVSNLSSSGQLLKEPYIGFRENVQFNCCETS